SAQAQDDQDFWLDYLHGIEDMEWLAAKPLWRQDARADKEQALVNLEIPARLATKLKAYCRQENISEFSFLLTCFQLLLARYSGQQQFAVGIVANLRDEVAWQHCVGPFIN